MKNASPKVKVEKKLAKKKSLGKPRRPLSAYNIFFKNERQKIMLEQKRNEQDVDFQQRNKDPRRTKHAHVGFANLAGIVSKRWKSIDPIYKNELEEKAGLEKKRYQNAVLEWKMKLNEEEGTEHKVSDSESVQEHVKIQGTGQTGEDLANEFAKLTDENEDSTPISTSAPTTPRFAGIKEALAFLNETSRATSKHLKGRAEIGSSVPRFDADSNVSPITVSNTSYQYRYRINPSAFRQIRLPFIASKDVSSFCPPCDPSESLLDSNAGAPFNAPPDASIVAERRSGMVGDPANGNFHYTANNSKMNDNIMMEARGSLSWTSSFQRGSYAKSPTSSTYTAADSSVNRFTMSLPSDPPQLNAYALNQIELPFNNDAHLQDFSPPCNTSRSMLNYDFQTCARVFPTQGMLHERRGSMPNSVMNINMFNSTMMGHNRRSSCPGFQEMDNYKPPVETYEKPIEEIRRFFGIDQV